jgi:hypothetical protein
MLIARAKSPSHNPLFILGEEQAECRAIEGVELVDDAGKVILVGLTSFNTRVVENGNGALLIINKANSVESNP